MRRRSIIIYHAMLAWLLLVGSVNSSAATYIEPDLTEELFMLEKIPLQVDKMQQLSGYLVVLARRPHNLQPAQQRATAQLIALAEALSPSNQEVRSLNRALARGRVVELSTTEEIARASKRLRSIKRWLGHPNAGEEANRLAYLLDDATKVLNPDTSDNKDVADWKDSIPSLDQYRPSRRDNPPPAKIADDDPPQRQPDAPEDNPWDTPEQVAKKYSIAQLTISAPLTLENATKHEDPKTGLTKYHRTRKHHVSEISLSIRPCRDPEDAFLRISSISRRLNGQGESLHKEIRQTLHGLMRSRHRNLAPHRIAVTISEGDYARSNQLALTAPLAIMLESSMTEKPLRKDVLVCADIDTAGILHAPANLWTSINHLRTLKTGGRLIVPHEASAVILQVLALEKPDFFIRWEVFAVNTLDEAMLAAASKSTGKLFKADMLFDSVQDLARRSPVTHMTMNRAVRTRLSEVASLCPQHLSSRALLLYGSNERPRRLDEKAQAHSVLEAVTHIRDTLANFRNYENPSYDTMKSAHEKARALLDPLERVIDRSDESFHHMATELANDVRSLANLIRRGRGDEDWYEYVRLKVNPEYIILRRRADDLHARVRAAAGYPKVVDDDEEKTD